jgi:hypothetical protein
MPHLAPARRFFPGLLALLAAAAARAQESRSALRFFGTGADQRDRVRIAIDDDAPGPDASTPADVGRGNFTIEFWLRGELADNDTANGGGDRSYADFRWIDGNIIADRDIWDGSEADFGISLAGGLVRFGTGRGDAGSDLDDTTEGSVNVLDGTWHHVACVRNALTGRKHIYVDGREDFAGGPGVSRADISYPDGGVPSQLTPWGPYQVLGAEKHDAGPAYPSFSGFLDELRIWSAARTAAEILDWRDRVVPAGTPGLAASYRFEEGSGTTIADTSGSGAPAGQLIAGAPGDGEWVAWADDPRNTAPVAAGPISPGAWKRCDFNCDGGHDVADAVAGLSFLFAAGDAPCCPALGDCNHDASGDISDWIFLLLHLFAGGPEPEPPFPGCETAPGEECETYAACP